MKRKKTKQFKVRNWLVMASLFLSLGLLAVRAIYLQVVNSDYLQEQGNARHLRLVSDNSHRGMILDRNGVPLAISTPVDSIWALPAELNTARKQWPKLVRKLGIKYQTLSNQTKRYLGREFMYIKRHVTPETAKQVLALNIPGINVVREYKRYYPAGIVTSHVIGLTNIDDKGQEGIELAYNDWLGAVAGKKRVLKDRLGNYVENVESVTLPIPGKDLVLSLDRRIQYLTYRALKNAVKKHGARSATAVVVLVKTGEVLAMVNYPGFNPNNRAVRRSSLFRNRAVTDVFEPGSTLKPFTIATALESGKFKPNSIINTSPGKLRIGNKTIRDTRNYGWLSITRIIEKSSNVGAAKIALQLSKHRLWQMLRQVGFGEKTGIQQPGESSGLLNPPEKWARLDQATISFGYGISVTSVQLARAYTVLANDGVLVPITLLPQKEPVKGIRVMSLRTARQVRNMLELAVSRQGTGKAAQIVHYRVAGKTGTVQKLINGNYSDSRYIASFAGFAPASKPYLVMVVTVDDPVRGGYYGGQIAAPVFSKVIAGTLRILNIAPDDVKMKSVIARTSKGIAG